jgi:hypothetical protein
MDYKDLDFFFPFVIFAYGAVMTFIFNTPKLLTLAEERLAPELYQQFKTRKALGTICLIVGGLWAMQNLWLS